MFENSFTEISLTAPEDSPMSIAKQARTCFRHCDLDVDGVRVHEYSSRPTVRRPEVKLPAASGICEPFRRALNLARGEEAPSSS